MKFCTIEYRKIGYFCKQRIIHVFTNIAQEKRTQGERICGKSFGIDKKGIIILILVLTVVSLSAAAFFANKTGSR